MLLLPYIFTLTPTHNSVSLSLYLYVLFLMLLNFHVFCVYSTNCAYCIHTNLPYIPNTRKSFTFYCYFSNNFCQKKFNTTFYLCMLSLLVCFTEWREISLFLETSTYQILIMLFTNVILNCLNRLSRVVTEIKHFHKALVVRWATLCS